MTRLQKKLSSGFDGSTTADQVLAGVSLRGRTAIVTGGHAGLGREVVRVLSGAGANVLIGARRPALAAEAVADLERISVAPLDLADPDSVDRFAGHFSSLGQPLHLLINNAGIMAVPLQRDAGGNELQLSTNHLGHFRLTARLWPRLVEANGARVVVLSSGAHRMAGVDLDDPNFRRRAYDKWQAYGQSKTATALFALALDERGAPHAVRAFSVHPGSIQTGLSGHLQTQDLIDIGAFDKDGRLTPAFARLSKTVAQGAATAVWCATSPQLATLGGQYCEDCEIADLLSADSTNLHGVMPWAVDAARARAWWEVSEQLAGVRFGI